MITREDYWGAHQMWNWGFFWKGEGGFLEVAVRKKVDTHPISWPKGTRDIREKKSTERAQGKARFLF